MTNGTKFLAGISALALLTGCPDDTPADTDGAESTGSDTTASPMTTMEPTTLGNETVDPGTTVDPDSGTTASVDTGTTVAPDTGTSGDSGTTGDSGTSESDSSSDSGTTGTGGNGDCVDENIGMAIGTPISTGNTNGQGDDFDWEACYDGGTGTGGFIGMDSGDGGFIGMDTGGDEGPGPGPGPGGLIGGGPAKGGIGGPGDDYVISWTPPSTGPFVLSLEGSSYDTYLSVTDPVCGGDPIDCNDDCFELESGLVFDATMGETVFIVIDGYDGDVGNFTLGITMGADLECGFGETDGMDTFGFIVDPTEGFSTTGFDSGGFIIDPSDTIGGGTGGTGGFIVDPTGGVMDTGVGFIPDPTG